MTLYYTGRVYDIGELTILDLNLFGGLSEARIESEDRWFYVTPYGGKWAVVEERESVGDERL